LRRRAVARLDHLIFAISMDKKKISIAKILQWIIKILLSGLALYLVYKKINKQDFVSIISHIDLAWLFPAVILFNISKVFSSIRLNGLLNNIGIETDHRTNLKLYYKGMFYNLFLPGGIGGDAYKTYVLNKGNDVPLKKIVGTMLYDRVSGLIMLIFIGCILAFDLLDQWKLVAILVGLMTIPTGYIFTRILFPSHRKNFTQSQLLSFAVQISQVLSVICILKALQVKLIAYFSYLFLFMISSVAAVVPITIGGAGAREVVFLYGEKLLNVSAETGIAIGLIFFMITVGSSLVGVFFKTTVKKN
jgi:glycosyltransferase 2 family protein